jgi:hypothetical protein
MSRSMLCGHVLTTSDHKPVMNFDTLLDQIGRLLLSQHTPARPLHVFVNSISPGCIHNGFIMTDTVEDELFLSLAGQIFLVPEADTLDYGLNTRQLFSLLTEVFGPLLPPEHSAQDTSTHPVEGSEQQQQAHKTGGEVFLLQEIKVSTHPDAWCNATGACKYAVILNLSTAPATTTAHHCSSSSSPVTDGNSCPPPPPDDRASAISASARSTTSASTSGASQSSRLVMFSNGLPNWPPRVGREIFFSS